MKTLKTRLILAGVTAVLAVSPVLAAARAPVEIRTTSPQGNAMAGEVILPEGAGPRPVVLLISGTGRQSRDFESFGGRYRPHRDIAEALLARDIGVIRFDERNTGASTGDHKTARSADLQNDIASILDAAGKVPDVDPKRIYLFGHSEGAVLAERLSIERKDIAGIVLIGAPGKSGRLMTLDQNRVITPRTPGMSDADFEKAVEEAQAKEVEFLKTRPSLNDLLELDALGLGRQVKVPVLILEGAEDWQVQPPQGEMLAKAMTEAGNKKVTYRKLPRVGHLMTDNPPGVTDYDKLTNYAVAPAVLEAVTTWLSARP